MNKLVTWSQIEAQQQFLELLKAVHKNPQLITDEQGKVIAAVVEIETFQKFIDGNQPEKKPSLADAFATLHQICAEENYTLETTPRIDRPHPFLSSY
jgi:hypothetical protein